jgi:anti-repressor protein
MKELIELKDRFRSIVQSTEKYPVDFDEAWQWIGYSCKDNALAALKKDFEEGTDFNLLNKKKVPIERGRRVERLFTTIFLTVECFKSFCMMAGTERGKEVWRYYLKIEKAWNTPTTLVAEPINDITEEQEMNELVSLELINGEKVDARTLWENLKSQREFANWIKNRLANFIEGVDYVVFDGSVKNPQGGRPRRDFLLTIKTAKHICLLERNEVGRKIRQYLIEVEEAWNTPELVMTRALQAVQKQIETYQQEIVELKIQNNAYKQSLTEIAEILQRQNAQGPFEKLPEIGSGVQKTTADTRKTKLPNYAVNSTDPLDMRVAAARINKPGWGRNKIFALLRKEKIMNTENVPYVPYLDKGYFKVFEYKWVDSKNEIHRNIKTLVYPVKGVEFIDKLIDREINNKA